MGQGATGEEAEVRAERFVELLQGDSSKLSSNRRKTTEASPVEIRTITLEEAERLQMVHWLGGKKVLLATQYINISALAGESEEDWLGKQVRIGVAESAKLMFISMDGRGAFRIRKLAGAGFGILDKALMRDLANQYGFKAGKYAATLDAEKHVITVALKGYTPPRRRVGKNAGNDEPA